ncbi:WbqC family protein [Psychroflexus salis]|uniref:WbqC-like protein family protein n=1 Tax=Psychroflexus salis TaxID=1526574 RepID=A0A917A048_9FLAO|nr:WbqC family protein [Psychroflexus salis]GGE19572.1 hypothetical protein GCM10010831_20870 [Psychroflexus salis]
MKKTLVQPLYFGPIDLFVPIAQADALAFEINENYQKQSYRTRQYIYGANGKLLLNIPIKHNGSGAHQLLKEVKIENDFKWQRLHWKSLESAYRTSPYFEFFEDDFYPLYHKKYEYLIDFTQDAWQVLLASLGLDLQIEFTSKYQEAQTDKEEINDLRFLGKAKRTANLNLDKYIQVFESKKGFISNLSILDLLFNEGTNALAYLRTQEAKEA